MNVISGFYKRRHKREKHGLNLDNTRREDILHKCDFCDYETLRKDYLVKHIKGVHLFERPFKCDFCDFTNATKLGFQIDDPTAHFLINVIEILN